MGFYEDHLKFVAKRQAQKLKQGESEKAIVQYLEACGWEASEVEEILNIAKRKVK